MADNQDYDDKYEHYNDMDFGGKGGKNRPKGAAGAGQGKDKAKQDASKGAATIVADAEKKRAADAKK